jgi:hypothetical protein
MMLASAAARVRQVEPDPTDMAERYSAERARSAGVLAVRQHHADMVMSGTDRR